MKSRKTARSARRRVLILGATGSIGRNAVWVARQLPEALEVVGLAACRNAELLAEQARVLGCRSVAMTDPAAARAVRASLPPGTEVYDHAAGLVRLVEATEADVVLCAIVGTAGLDPVLAAIRRGLTIALASKEILVMAGALVMAEARRCGVRILPVDSEHSALFQCLEGRSPETVRRLILTASGGPFRTTPLAQLTHITAAQALAHPTWNMGAKVTLDSATLMNKGLELIEAHWLFDMPEARLDVVIHPQSVVHSLVEFCDTGLLAQLGRPDMRVPIQYALTWPRRLPMPLEPLDLAAVGRLDFAPPDTARFPALALARHALRHGGTLPAVMNAANEVAVARFLKGGLSFPGIVRCVRRVMEKHDNTPQPALAQILAADAWARAAATRAR